MNEEFQVNVNQPRICT